MCSRVFLIAPLLIPSIACAQFVWPQVKYHEHDAGVYQEDPFITKYRTKFFAVFHGDIKTFEDAYHEIQGMVEKDPHDARAMVWLGNGQTIEAGILYAKGKRDEGAKLLATSRQTMNRAVQLHPEDYGVYMMRAATLYVQGEFWDPKFIPRDNWLTLRDDCEHLLKQLGPKVKSVSVHVRGETYGELGIAYQKLGDKPNAKKAFENILKYDPKTDYAAKAQSELTKIEKG